MQHILVVEDDAIIAQAVADRLRSEGFQATVVGDGNQAVQQAAEISPALIVLDLMLPGLDGLEVCRRVQADRAVPVIMLTAKADEVDMIVGLGVGADDYLTKPFSPRELVARIRALLRRVQRDKDDGASGNLVVGEVTMDVARRIVTRSGARVHLTATEFDLFAVLAAEVGVVKDRPTIVRSLWGYSDEAAERTVDSHVRAIRAKLGDEVVRTVRGVGYAAQAPADAGGGRGVASP
ncbi:response regulator transcription factor [Euzebya tangerina]|uniref:response regulator transcription factor n=1 Tax=Euzebya tangerina TaxID=591198 RepID=UPI000E31B0BA|nr:response regulator transcription factor [Euzebya tangerina]